jgi:hypothetical protein
MRSPTVFGMWQSGQNSGSSGSDGGACPHGIKTSSQPSMRQLSWLLWPWPSGWTANSVANEEVVAHGRAETINATLSQIHPRGRALQMP